MRNLKQWWYCIYEYLFICIEDMAAVSLAFWPGLLTPVFFAWMAVHTYIHTDTARIQHVNVGLAQARLNQSDITHFKLGELRQYLYALYCSRHGCSFSSLLTRPFDSSIFRLNVSIDTGQSKTKDITFVKTGRQPDFPCINRPWFLNGLEQG